MNTLHMFDEPKGKIPQYTTSKNPPWARGVALAQAASVGGPQSLGATLLTAQASHNAAAAVVAAQTQQANQQTGGSFGPGLAALGLQVLRQETAMSFGPQKNALPPVMSQPGLALAVSMAPTTAPVGAGPMLHVSQPGIALPTTLATTQVATVSYPAPRLMGQPAPQFQTAHHQATHQAVHQAVATANQQQQAQKPQQRVFTGTVTKLHDNFGFVDEDVFFQTSAIKGSMPKVCERVLVEATYNPNMPFKWNATRIQVLPNQLNPSSSNRPGISVACSMAISPSVSTVGSVVTSGMPIIASSSVSQFGNSLCQRMTVPTRRHTPPPSISRREREVRREERRERYREREYERYSPTPIKRPRSPKRPSRSPPRRRLRVVPRYNVQIPKISLDLRDGNIVELRKRYNNLYIPSDFFCANFLWQDAFPAHRPFGLDHPCTFHIMSKDVEPVVPNDAVLEPPDADYLFSAKVMLLSTPPLEEIFQRACALAEDGDEYKENFVHPTRLISFLVGLKGKNETVAIGGPWSPSLDGPNPDTDPSVLIKTAVRTCKALTGIDLSRTTHWYRFSEIHYRRGESTHKGRVVPKRVETVVIFLPADFSWSCVPTALEWDQLAAGYKKQLQQKLREEMEETNESQEDEETVPDEATKQEPTHYSELDPKTMKVSDLRGELEARGLNMKGLKSQLIARLSKVLKAESEKEEQKEIPAPKTEKEELAEAEKLESDIADDEKKKKEEEEKKLKEEKERVAFEKRFQLPEVPAVLVHPSPVAKGGKFDCTIMSLSVLLDYRQEDNKEHSFEVSLFAELFNEMLMRDFGFSIYCALADAPDLKEDDKDKKKLDKKDDRKDKDDKKKEGEEYSEKDEEQSAEDELQEEDEEQQRTAKDSKDKKKKKDKKLQTFTAKPDLLLSFVYFDQNHCGYIAEKDLEEILYVIGLNLSRSQVRKLLQKLVKKEMLHYRKMTDKLLTEQQQDNKDDESVVKKKTIEELAAGNKKYLPVFKMPSLVCPLNTETVTEMEIAETPVIENNNDSVDTNEQLVVYKGALLDVEKLLQQLKRSEKARADTEEKMREMQEELDEMHEAASISEQNAQKLSVELEKCNQKLKTSEDDLRIAQIQVEKYQRALGMCRDQLHLLLGSVETSLEGTPTIITNSRKPISYSLITKTERMDTHTIDAD